MTTRKDATHAKNCRCSDFGGFVDQRCAEARVTRKDAQTPGPWEVHAAKDDFNSVLVCKPDGSKRGCRPVAEAEILGVAREEAEANARLIAKAPEMLALLRELTEAATYTWDKEPLHAALEKSRALLAEIDREN